MERIKVTSLKPAIDQDGEQNGWRLDVGSYTQAFELCRIFRNNSLQARNEHPSRLLSEEDKHHGGVHILSDVSEESVTEILQVSPQVDCLFQN